jgi:hypothetical protein
VELRASNLQDGKLKKVRPADALALGISCQRARMPAKWAGEHLSVAGACARVP